MCFTCDLSCDVGLSFLLHGLYCGVHKVREGRGWTEDTEHAAPRCRHRGILLLVLSQ